MNNELKEFREKIHTHEKMITSLAKYLDKLENNVSSIKNDIGGFDGRMLIMALRIIELQEMVESIEELIQSRRSSKPSILERIKELIQNKYSNKPSILKRIKELIQSKYRKKPPIIERIKELIQNRKSKKPYILESQKNLEHLSGELSSSKELDGYSLKGEVEYEQDLSQFLSQLEERNKESSS